jgi:hypothetical protein
MTLRIYVSLLARQTARLATKRQSDIFQRLSTNLGRRFRNSVYPYHARCPWNPELQGIFTTAPRVGGATA